jgi:hypothetical protein
MFSLQEKKDKEAEDTRLRGEDIITRRRRLARDRTALRRERATRLMFPPLPPEKKAEEKAPDGGEGKGEEAKEGSAPPEARRSSVAEPRRSSAAEARRSSAGEPRRSSIAPRRASALGAAPAPAPAPGK